MQRHHGQAGQKKRQKGIATILIILLLGLAVTVTVLLVAHSLRSTQQRQLSTHSATAAQGAAWRGVEVVRTYLRQLPKETLQQWGPEAGGGTSHPPGTVIPVSGAATASGGSAGGSDTATTEDSGAAATTATTCKDYAEGLAIGGMESLGISGRLIQVCGVDDEGAYRVTARVTGHSGSGSAATTSTVEVVYDVSPRVTASSEPTEGGSSTVPTPTASFVGTLNYDGSMLNIVDGPNASDIAVDGTINFNGVANFSACSTQDINFSSNQYCGSYYRAAGAITGRGATFGKLGGSCASGVVEGVTLHAGTGVDLSFGGASSNGRFWSVQTAAGDIRINGTSQFLAPSGSLWGGGSISLGSAGSSAVPVSEVLAAGDLTLGAGNQLSWIDLARIGGSIYIDSWNNRIGAGTVGGSVVVRSGNQASVQVTPGGGVPTPPPAPDCAVSVPAIDVNALRVLANLILDFADGDRSRPVLQIQNMTPASLNTSYDLTTHTPTVLAEIAALFGCDAAWCRNQAIPTYDSGTGYWRLPAFGTIQPGVVWVNGSLNIQPNSGFTFYNAFLVTEDIRFSNNGFVIYAPNFAASDANVCAANRNPVNLCTAEFVRNGASIGNMAVVAARNATLNSTIHGNVVIGNTLEGTTGSIRINGRLAVGTDQASDINFSNGGFAMTVDSSALTAEQTVIETGGETGEEPTDTGASRSRVRWSRYL